MRIRAQHIHSSQLEEAVNFACRASGASVTIHVEDKRTRYPYYYGYEVRLFGDGTLSRRRAAGHPDQYAATYEQWGHFINHLFSVEPGASCGTYAGRADFDTKTHGKFPALPQLPR